MALEDIIKTIEDEAAKEVASILATANKEQESVREETSTLLAERKLAWEREMRAILEANERRSRARARQEAALHLENVKRRAIDLVLDEAVASLESLSSKDYIDFMKRAMVESGLKKEEIDSVVAPKTRKEETKELLSAIGVKVAPDCVDTFGFGLILSGRRVSYDLSLARLVLGLRSRLEMEIGALIQNS